MGVPAPTKGDGRVWRWDARHGQLSLTYDDAVAAAPFLQLTGHDASEVTGPARR